ncbi:MAG: hypothetical protein QME05_03410 [Candidatus Margulisbacteria bacterium]|nr:hypothetical protein [Candidatus Margulisiibacteriota bacterium]
MTKKQAALIDKLSHAKVLIDYKDYSWLIKNYLDLLEDAELIKAKELKKAEKDLAAGRLCRWEDVKRALRL